ncbi:MAG: heavy metal translocating P-type ATPase, partial [Pseudobdellovibrio sp.]
EKIPDYNSDCRESRLNMSTSELHLRVNREAKLSTILDLITEMGYTPHPIKIGSDHEDALKKETRQDLKRIAVAGACAGNIMIYAISIYAGVDGFLLEVFKWLNLILFLPVLFYSALPFYKGAWSSLKIHKIHIDLPITLALVTSTVFSTYNLIKGNDNFYFDSTASFVFLILSARFFVKKAQRKFLTPQNLQTLVQNEQYTVNYKQTLAENIQIHDKVKATLGQIIPVDGTLLSEYALIDTAFISGESVPYSFTKGMKVFAGYKVLSDSVLIKCEQSVKQTRLSHLLERSFEKLMTKNNYLNLADRLSEKLITTVFAVGALFFVSYGFYSQNWSEAFNRTLALIVVACPCSLAFGSPLTMALAYNKAQEKGIAVRNPNVFEKIKKIKNIFFDKTGTLTYGKLYVKEIGPHNLSQETIQIILSLEKISYHPVAFALREHFSSTPHGDITIQNHEEVFGLGVRGKINGHFYEIKALSKDTHESTIDLAVALYKDNEIQHRIYFQDNIREESREIIAKLKALGKNCFLLTGDKKIKALYVGATCGIEQENIYAHLYPENKKEIISHYENTFMIGDGVNDSLALSQSDVSAVIKGGAEIALSTSDIFFLKSGLKPLLDLFSIHKIIDATLKRNLQISLIYNATAATLALFGYINPLWAAVLMPMSSFIILISTLWGFRKC